MSQLRRQRFSGSILNVTFHASGPTPLLKLLENDKFGIFNFYLITNTYKTRKEKKAMNTLTSKIPCAANNYSTQTAMTTFCLAILDDIYSRVVIHN